MGRPSPPSPAAPPSKRFRWLRWPFALVVSAILTALMLLGLASFRLTTVVATAADPRLVASLQPPLATPTARADPVMTQPPPQKLVPASSSRTAQPRRQAAITTAPMDVPRREASGANPGIPSAMAPAPTAGDAVAVDPPASGALPSPQAGRAGPAAIATPRPQSTCTLIFSPAFPREANEDGIRHGAVIARLYPEADGHVTRVEVLSATPASHARYFEREMRRALAHWRCTLTGGDEAIRQVFIFRLEE